MFMLIPVLTSILSGNGVIVILLHGVIKCVSKKRTAGKIEPLTR